MNGADLHQWVSEILRPILAGQSPSSDASVLGGVALLSADADRIKDSVFESAKLPEIRGASQIIRGLTQAETSTSLALVLLEDGLPDECLIYAGGGSLLALVPTVMAAKLCREMEARYARDTGAGTLTAVFSPQPPTVLATQFGECVRQVGQDLRAAKQSRAVAPHFEVSPLGRRCASCGARPASQNDPRLAEARYLCWVCSNKISQGDRLEFEPKFERIIESDDLYVAGWPTGSAGLSRAHDLTDIAAVSRDRLVGLIYVDGDGVGDLLFASESISAYRTRSQALTAVMERVVLRTLARRLQPAKERHSFEIIAIGGDDAILFVPGDAALVVALEICEIFTSELAQRGWNPAPTMSAGVIIAHERNPVRFMREMAEQLLRSAKQRTHRDEGGAIDFALLKSQSTLATGLEVLREQAYGYSISDREFATLTGRPFSLLEMRRILDGARLLREAAFPRSQSQRLREVFRDTGRLGRLWPWLYYHRQKQRLSRRHRAILDRIEADWQATPTVEPPSWPWLPSAGQGRLTRFRSIWEDLHEARELLPRTEPADVTAAINEVLKATAISAEDAEVGVEA